jgi:plasmid stabilization system protein ParE
VSLPVRFSAEAAAELEAAAQWYEEQRPGLGGTFVDAVETTLDRIARWPESGVLIDGVDAGLDIRRVPVQRFPYHLPYVVLGDHLRVLAVAYDRRRPQFWGSRASRA